MKKGRFLGLKTDEEAKRFLPRIYRTSISPSSTMRFEFQPKEKSINLRISEPLLKAVQATPSARHPYQRYSPHSRSDHAEA